MSSYTSCKKGSKGCLSVMMHEKGCSAQPTECHNLLAGKCVRGMTANGASNHTLKASCLKNGTIHVAEWGTDKKPANACSGSPATVHWFSSLCSANLPISTSGCNPTTARPTATPTANPTTARPTASPTTSPTAPTASPSAPSSGHSLSGGGAKCDVMKGPQSWEGCADPSCMRPQPGCNHVTRYASTQFGLCCANRCFSVCETVAKTEQPTASPSASPTTGLSRHSRPVFAARAIVSAHFHAS